MPTQNNSAVDFTALIPQKYCGKNTLRPYKEKCGGKVNQENGHTFTLILKKQKKKSDNIGLFCIRYGSNIMC